MAYSLSASLASISKSIFHTPLLAQREKRVWIFDQVAKAFGQVPPREAGPITVDHRFNKQPIVLGRYPDMPLTSGEDTLSCPIDRPEGRNGASVSSEMS